MSNEKDSVNHPDHYGGKDNVYETIKVIEAFGWTEGFCLGNALKYLSRAGKKDPSKKIEDLEKGRFYLDYYINHLKKPENKTASKDTQDDKEFIQIEAADIEVGNVFKRHNKILTVTNKEVKTHAVKIDYFFEVKNRDKKYENMLLHPRHTLFVQKSTLTDSQK